MRIGTSLGIAATLALVVGVQAIETQQRQPYKSARGAFEAAFPVKPSEVVRKQQRGDATLDFTIATARRGQATFSVASADLNGRDSNSAALLDSARDEVVKSLKGTITSESEIDFEGHPGRAIEVAIPRAVMAGGGTGHVRLYLIGSRLFELTIVQPARVATSATEADAFFRSFHPTDAPPAPKTELAQSKAVKSVDTAPAKAAATSSEMRKAAARSTTPAARAVPAGWKVFSPPEGHVTVAFPPGMPERKVLDQETRLGKVQFLIDGVVHEGMGFQVMVADAIGVGDDATQREVFLRGYQNGLIGKSGKTLVRAVALDVEGLSGLEIVADCDPVPGSPLLANGGRIHVRAVVSGKLVYSAIVTVPKGAAAPPDSLDEFLGSLTVDGKSIVTVAPDTLTSGAAGKTERVIQPKSKAGWHVHQDPAGAFSLSFPDTPKATKQPIKTPQGIQLMSDIVVIELPNAGAFMIMSQALPTGVIPNGMDQLALDGSVKSLAANTPGKLVRSESIRLGTVPGREVEMDLNATPTLPGGGILLMRVYTAGSTLHMVMRVMPKTGDRAEALEFLDGFRLAEPK